MILISNWIEIIFSKHILGIPIYLYYLTFTLQLKNLWASCHNFPPPSNEGLALLADEFSHKHQLQFKTQQHNQWIIEMPSNGIPFWTDIMGGLLFRRRRENEKKFGFVSSLSLLFSHMENLEKHAMGRALLTQKDENSPEKDDLKIKKYPIKFYLL